MTDPRRRTFHAAALGIGGCLLLAACGASTTEAGPTPAAGPATASAAGSSAPPGPASSDPAPAVSAPDVSEGGDACTLVTEEEAGAALGKDPGPGSPFTSHGATQCQYGTYEAGFVLVNVTPTQGKAAFARMRNNPKVSDAGVVSDVAGLGDQAFEIDGPHTASIYFGMGDALFLVSVVTPGTAASPKGQVLALAKTAAGRA